MKKFEEFQKPVLVVVGILLLITVIYFFFSFGGSKAPENIDEIKVSQSGTTLTVRRNGSVEILTNDGLFTDEWSEEKTNAFFDYFLKKSKSGVSSGDNSITLNGESGSESTNYAGSDELAGAVINEATGGSGGGSAPGATPKPPPPTGLGGGWETATPKPPPPTGLGGGHPSCLFWVLSYCVNFPSPSPTPTPIPGENVIEASGCEDWNAQTSQATVINNTVCITE